MRNLKGIIEDQRDQERQVKVYQGMSRAPEVIRTLGQGDSGRLRNRNGNTDSEDPCQVKLFGKMRETLKQRIADL